MSGQVLRGDKIILRPEDEEGYRRHGQALQEQEFRALVDEVRRNAKDPDAWIVYSFHRTRNAAMSRKMGVKRSGRIRALPLRIRVTALPTADNPERHAVVLQWDTKARSVIDMKKLYPEHRDRLMTELAALIGEDGEIGNGQITLPWEAVVTKTPIYQVPDSPVPLPRPVGCQVDDEIDDEYERPV
jgi:hypothetical protein